MNEPAPVGATKMLNKSVEARGTNEDVAGDGDSCN